MVRRALALIAMLFLVAACGSGGNDDPTPTPSGTAASVPQSGPIPSDPPEGVANKPKPGAYTYELQGEGGAQIAEGTVVTETITVSGDNYTSKITNNQTGNSATVKRQWLAEAVVRTAFASVIAGTTTECAIAPAVQILHLPIKEETFQPQSWESANCDGTVSIRVISRELVEDTNKHAWATWKIEERENVTVKGGKSDHKLVRWFSPALGVDIRTTDSSGTRKTMTILSSHP